MIWVWTSGKQMYAVSVYKMAPTPVPFLKQNLKKPLLMFEYKILEALINSCCKIDYAWTKTLPLLPLKVPQYFKLCYRIYSIMF